MEERIRWVKHKGKQILSLDYTGLRDKEFIDFIKKAADYIINLKRHNLLILVNINDTVIGRTAITAFKNNTKAAQPCIKKTAALGIAGVNKFLLQVINRFSGLGVIPFDTLEEAKDWLIE